MQIHRPVAALLIAVLCSARAEVVDIRWSGDGRFNHDGTIAAGKSVEICGKLPAGTAVRWNFEAAPAVDFNVHYHVGQDVVFPFKRSAVGTAKNTLVTKIEQDYCWMWSNKSAATATLSVQLQK
jgi:hypothetical protein